MKESKWYFYSSGTGLLTHTLEQDGWYRTKELAMLNHYKIILEKIELDIKHLKKKLKNIQSEKDNALEKLLPYKEEFPEEFL